MSNTNTKEQNIISSIYAVLFVVAAASFVPYMGIQSVASFMFLAVLIALYVYKARAEEDSLMHNHMVFLIRTIWISSLVFVLGLVAFYFLGDHFVPTQLAENISAGQTIPTEEDMRILTQQYLQDNLGILTVCFAPGIIYFVYRLSVGAARAIKGYRILNPRSWI
jgi:uncharacterized membrane protein